MHGQRLTSVAALRFPNLMPAMYLNYGSRVDNLTDHSTIISITDQSRIANYYSFRDFQGGLPGAPNRLLASVLKDIQKKIQQNELVSPRN